jgi:hypothetical protein
MYLQLISHQQEVLKLSLVPHNRQELLKGRVSMPM